jgi:protein-S-isoprenylcysteine O-methyltransferase Ste14
MALDVKRLSFSPEFPLWLKMWGFIFLIIAQVYLYKTFKQNTFLIPVVRIQKDRRQKVISTGVYSFVRHPMYSSACLMFLSAPLFVGSLLSLYVGIALLILFMIRCVLEENKLRKELKGYDKYMKKVKFRLIPYVF